MKKSSKKILPRESKKSSGDEVKKLRKDILPSQLLGHQSDIGMSGFLIAAGLVAVIVRLMSDYLPVHDPPPRAPGPGDPLSPPLKYNISAEVLEQQDRVWKMRRELNNGRDKGGKLAKLVSELHRTIAYQRIAALTISNHRYGTERLLGDAATITSYQKNMLLLGKNAQILDVPSMQLPAPNVSGHWAAYNPSVVPIRWLGRNSLLVTYRLSTWNLCTWAANGSPLGQLPVVDGKKRTTSKVAAAIFFDDFRIALPLHDMVGMDHELHHCIHHTGMVRMGVDDGRLFLLNDKPWMIYAAVAPQGHTAYCFHNTFACQVQVPNSAKGKIQCKRKIRLNFERANRISEQHRAAGRMPNVHQKNWVSYVWNEQLYLIFTVEPLVVVRVNLETGECIEVSETHTPIMKIFHKDGVSTPSNHRTFGLHGGSPLIPLPKSLAGDDEFLGIGRIARGNIQYVLFFFTIVPSSSKAGEDDRTVPGGFEISRVSPIFCFASTSRHHRGLCETIQFAGGMFLDGDANAESNLVVTYGTNDCEAKVAFLPLQRVLTMLQSARNSKHG